MDLFGLKGRVAVVTGASSGLGADAARAYAAYGADVALVARRKERLESLAEELRREGVKALPVACDVSREDDVRAAVERIMDYFGRVDILLNDAGVAVPGGVETLTAEEWDRSMDINVRGMFLMCKYVVPHMRERRYGKIVNISSVNATLADKVPELWRHAYNASKAAVKGLTVGMAASYAADNITVRQGNSSNIVYIFQNRSTLLKSGIRLFGKVDLCYIAGKNHLRTSTNTGKCHFQNRKCGILALINDDHTVIQSTASHICKRCNLNDSPFS